MAYNTGVYKQRSTLLANLDCNLNVKGVPNDDGFVEARFTATTTTVVAVGECVGMIRIPANAVILDAQLYWDDAAPAAVVAIGDPFACARLLGPIHTGTARGVSSSSFANCSPWGQCGSLSKMGVQGDGCGFGYRYTCETDVIMTNLYSDALAQGGGWAGSAGAAASNPGMQSTAINAGTFHLILHYKKATSVT